MEAYVWFRRRDEAAAIDNLNVMHGEKLPAELRSRVIIPWGVGVPVPDHAVSLNSQQAVQACLDREEMRERLALNGIRYMRSNRKNRGKSNSFLFMKRYAVPVFNLQALSVFETGVSVSAGESAREGLRSGNTYLQLADSRMQRWLNKIGSLAQKAVHALDLDYAVVSIVREAGSRLYVAEIDPYPSLSGGIGQCFVKAMNRFDRELRAETGGQEGSRQVMLGADLELVLVDGDGGLAPADRFFPRRGKLGCDAVVSQNGGIWFPLVELRPAPDKDPLKLLARIHRLLRKASEQTNADHLHMLAGAMPIEGLPLGGHIHFSGVWANVFLIRALDAYLTLPLKLIEDPAGNKRRPDYGFPGDVKPQFHGGFEYRTPPSWIVSPRVAAAILVLSKLIAENFWKLGSRPFADKRTIKAYYSTEPGLLLAEVEALWRELRALPDYAAYGAILDSFLEMLTSGAGWDERRDIRFSWKLAAAPVKV